MYLQAHSSLNGRFGCLSRPKTSQCTEAKCFKGPLEKTSLQQTEAEALDFGLPDHSHLEGVLPAWYSRLPLMLEVFKARLDGALPT